MVRIAMQEAEAHLSQEGKGTPANLPTTPSNSQQLKFSH